MTRSAKNYCFTINNPTEEDTRKLKDAEDPEIVSYLCYGKERGESGTPHYQGFISFVKRRTLGWVKNHVSERAHFEQAKGSPTQNRAYCSKEAQDDSDFYEWGQCPGGSGTRTDLSALVAAIKSGRRKRDIADEFGECFLRYSRGIDALRVLYTPERDWEVEVIVYWGKTGTGKTRRAWEVLCQKDAFFYPGYKGAIWFDGYDNHENVIFDDYTGSVFHIAYLLKLMDRYPMKVPVKCGFVQWIPKRMIFTSNINPDDWYTNAYEQHREALKRRINVRMEFTV